MSGNFAINPNNIGPSQFQVFEQHSDKRQTSRNFSTRSAQEMQDRVRSQIADRNKPVASTTSSVSLKERAVSVLNGIGQILAWPFKKIYQFVMWLLWPCCKPSNMIDRFAGYPERTARDFAKNPLESFNELIDSFVDHPEETANALIDLTKMLIDSDEEEQESYGMEVAKICASILLGPKADQIVDLINEAQKTKDPKEAARVGKEIEKLMSENKKLEAGFKDVMNFVENPKLNFTSFKKPSKEDMALFATALSNPAVMASPVVKGKIFGLIEGTINDFMSQNPLLAKIFENSPFAKQIGTKLKEAFDKIFLKDSSIIVKFFSQLIIRGLQEDGNAEKLIAKVVPMLIMFAMKESEKAKDQQDGQDEEIEEVEVDSRQPFTYNQSAYASHLNVGSSVFDNE